MKEERLTEQTPGEIADAPTPQNQPSKCFTVIDSSYDVGLSTYAFWSREEAERSIRESIVDVVADLKDRDWDNVEVLEQGDSFSVYVPDTGISYDWTISETEIR